MKAGKKKKRKLHNAVTFKPYQQHQIWLLPPSLGDLIPSGHIVRIVNDIIDGMDLAPILSTYEGGGTSSYHPRMMLKALVYGYTDKQYSSRGIEKACKENICYMWLCGMQQPDHNSLNRFRRHRLNGTVKQVFTHVLQLLVEQGYVRLQDYYVDGTKIESVANRYTYVWQKNVERYKDSLLDKIALILEQIEQVNEQAEQEATSQNNSAETKSAQKEESRKQSSKDSSSKKPARKVVDSQALQESIERINKDLSAALGDNKKLKKKLEKLEQEHLPKLQKYEEQERILNGRSSYSKTDPDATFMRTKEDHLGNGQLKPSYNWQFGTEGQFVVNYTLTQTASDMSSFKPHMEDTLQVLESINAPKPKRVGADAGYGSEENYEFLEENGMDAYVKYPGFYKEQKKAKPKQVFKVSRLYYNEEQDFFVCPIGQHMHFTHTSKQTTKTGYEQEIRHYQAKRCDSCPLRGTCHRAKGNRVVQYNRKTQQYRQAAKERLNSLRGIRMRKQRNIDVEPVFGHIKQCRGFRRCLLTGLDGVSIETGLLVIAHNLKKLHATKKKPRIDLPSPSQNPPNSPQIALDLPQIKKIKEKTRA